MNDDREWFAPRRYGLGSGPPIAWQGWALSAAFVAIVFLAATLLLPAKPLAFVAILVPATAIFLLICSRTTRGGWRWRWGRDD